MNLYHPSRSELTWYPAEQYMPEEGKPVLCALTSDDGMFVVMAEVSLSDGHWRDTYDDERLDEDAIEMWAEVTLPRLV